MDSIRGSFIGSARSCDIIAWLGLRWIFLRDGIRIGAGFMMVCMRLCIPPFFCLLASFEMSLGGREHSPRMAIMDIEWIAWGIEWRRGSGMVYLLNSCVHILHCTDE